MPTGLGVLMIGDLVVVMLSFQATVSSLGPQRSNTPLLALPLSSCIKPWLKFNGFNLCYLNLECVAQLIVQPTLSFMLTRSMQRLISILCMTRFHIMHFKFASYQTKISQLTSCDQRPLFNQIHLPTRQVEALKTFNLMGFIKKVLFFVFKFVFDSLALFEFLLCIFI